MRKNTPLRVEKRLRPVGPLGRNRVGPFTRNPALSTVCAQLTHDLTGCFEAIN
jgi:hypothetical protein